GTDVATLLGFNDNIKDPDVIIAGDKLRVPSGDLVSYTVREGDTLNTIAAQHGVTVEGPVVINKLDGPDLIRPGEVLLMYVAEEGEAGMQGVDADDEDVDAATSEPTATEGAEPADVEDTAEATAEPTEEAAPDASIGDDEEAEADAAAEDED